MVRYRVEYNRTFLEQEEIIGNSESVIGFSIIHYNIDNRFSGIPDYCFCTVDQICLIGETEGQKTMKLNTVHFGDCLDILKEFPDNSLDVVITDPPFGVTNCDWDSIIPISPMWEQLNRVVKPGRAVCLFGTEPFCSLVRVNNLENYKYDWIWKKPNGTNPFRAKYSPMVCYEKIMVFGKGKIFYNPQMREGKPYKWNSKRSGEMISQSRETPIDNKGTRYPNGILEFAQERGLYPTQKPTDLIKYLINTYSNEGDVVLDFASGSGTTAIACMDTNRQYICIEKDEKGWNISNDRVERKPTTLVVGQARPGIA